jgi:hypothetical protein
MSSQIVKKPSQVLFNGTIATTIVWSPSPNVTLYAGKIDLGDYVAESNIIKANIYVKKWYGSGSYGAIPASLVLRVYTYDSFGNLLGYGDAYGPFAYAESPWIIPFYFPISVIMIIDLGSARKARFILELQSLLANVSADVAVSVEG